MQDSPLLLSLVLISVPVAIFGTMIFTYYGCYYSARVFCRRTRNACNNRQGKHQASQACQPYCKSGVVWDQETKCTTAILAAYLDLRRTGDINTYFLSAQGRSTKLIMSQTAQPQHMLNFDLILERAREWVRVIGSECEWEREWEHSLFSETVSEWVTAWVREQMSGVCVYNIIQYV